MTKKTLFITYKAPSAILEGGGQGAQKNYNTICQIVGKENVATYYVHDENQKTSVWRYLISGILTIFNYYYGLTPWRVRKIVQMAQPFDFVFIDRLYSELLQKN